MISNSMLKYPQQIWECPWAPCLKKNCKHSQLHTSSGSKVLRARKGLSGKNSAFPRHIMKLEHRGGVIGKPIKFDHGRSQHCCERQAT